MGETDGDEIGEVNQTRIKGYVVVRTVKKREEEEVYPLVPRVRKIGQWVGGFVVGWGGGWRGGGGFGGGGWCGGVWGGGGGGGDLVVWGEGGSSGKGRSNGFRDNLSGKEKEVIVNTCRKGERLI